MLPLLCLPACQSSREGTATRSSTSSATTTKAQAPKATSRTVEEEPSQASAPARKEGGSSTPALPDKMTALSERWETPWWIIAYDSSSAFAMRTADRAADNEEVVFTLYDRDRALSSCLEKEGAAFMIDQEGMKPEQIYSMKASPVAVVADLITIEVFESSMCEGGAHPMNTFELQTLKFPMTDAPTERLAIGDVFDEAIVREAFDADPLLAHLARYHKRYHEAPQKGTFQDLSPCLYEVPIPEPGVLTSWAFTAFDARADKVSVALLLSNPVHACAGQPLRHTVELSAPEALSSEIARASKAKTLYSQSNKGGIEP